MLKIEKFRIMSPEQWEMVIEGVRNPMNSWAKMDSHICKSSITSPDECEECQHNIFDCPVPSDDIGDHYIIGPNDHKLLMNLAKGGPVEAKYRRMTPVWVTLIAPLYWWKEYDTYKVGTVANSCSTMHKIHSEEFTLDDFSCEHLSLVARHDLAHTISTMNLYRDLFINWDEKDDNTKNALLCGIIDGEEYKRKDAWWQMIQLLPTSYNQKRTLFLNYEVLQNIYHSRKNHKLDEWHVFCDWIRELPYSEIIIGEESDEDDGV